MKPLYELRDAEGLSPQIYENNREDEMTPFISSTGISIYPVPMNNAVGTNHLADAVTIISFADGKIRYNRFFDHTLNSRHAFNCFSPQNIPDTIGLIETPWVLMYNLKNKALKKYKVLSGDNSVGIHYVADAAKNRFIVHEEEKILNSGSRKTESQHFLNLIELSGSNVKVIKKKAIDEGIMWITSHDRIFLWHRHDDKLQILDMSLEPSEHPLAGIIKRSKIKISEIHPHPTLPFAIIYDHEGAMSVSWGKGRDESPALIIRRAMDFQFSPDGKWVTFTYGRFTDQIRKTYLLPVSEKYSFFVGKPILLWDDAFVPGKTAWTRNPISFVGSQSGKIYRWEFTNESHPESDKSTYHEYIVGKDLKMPPVKMEIPSYESDLKEKHIVRLDGFSPMRESSFKVSPDIRRIAYVSEGTSRVAAVIDGKVGNSYHKISEIIFSPDGKRVAYPAQVNDKLFAVVDGEEENREYDNMEAFTFSPDGKRFAYGAAQKKKWFWVLDGKMGKPQYDYIAAIVFSPDSKRVAYVVSKDNKWIVVVDGKKGRPYDRIGALIFSPDSRRIAYMAMSKGKMFVVVDEHEQIKCDNLGAKPVFSPDGKHLAYAIVEDDKWFAVINGKKGKPYDSGGYLVFSPDSKQMAYIAQLNGKWFAVIDGEEKQKCDDISIGGITFSPDGKRIAYGAFFNNRCVGIIDGKKQTKQYDNMGLIVFSPDSKRLAYPVKSGKKVFAIVDGKEGYPYDAIWSLVISPNSKHVAYVAKEDKKVFVVVDGKEGKKYDDILAVVGGGLVFDADNRLHYIAVKDRQIDPGDDDTVLMAGDTLCLVEENIKDNE